MRSFLPLARAALLSRRGDGAGDDAADECSSLVVAAPPLDVHRCSVLAKGLFFYFIGLYD